jgi:hypothetical protein
VLDADKKNLRQHLPPEKTSQNRNQTVNYVSETKKNSSTYKSNSDHLTP